MRIFSFVIDTRAVLHTFDFAVGGGGGGIEVIFPMTCFHLSFVVCHLVTKSNALLRCITLSLEFSGV
ncbi:hypothetical protein VTL71DRAFT_13647 [Oculimacula yallundae]|uniref:Uncharacterized protein n=1 Tax=Oculimacula yallundae TaxID=86028 RepID=A0ABR4CN36_9HELO